MKCWFGQILKIIKLFSGNITIVISDSCVTLFCSRYFSSVAGFLCSELLIKFIYCISKGILYMFCTRKYKIKKLDSAIKNNFMVTKSLCSFESSSGTILATV
jgi:hypothetical protein